MAFSKSSQPGSSSSANTGTVMWGGFMPLFGKKGGRGQTFPRARRRADGDAKAAGADYTAGYEAAAGSSFHFARHRDSGAGGAVAGAVGEAAAGGGADGGF